MESRDPSERKRTLPTKITSYGPAKEFSSAAQQNICCSNIEQNKYILPKPGPYQPFLPSSQPVTHEEYSPVPIVVNPVTYQYIPKPLKPQKPVGSNPKIPKRVAPKNKSKPISKSLPTALIPPDSIYWIPLLDKTKKPTRDRIFFYHTMQDKERVKVYSYKTGQIDVFRKGVWVTIRQPEKQE